jgi:hypothetical protein
MVVMEELDPMCDGEIVGFSPTSEIDGGEAQQQMVVMEELDPMCDGEIVGFSPTSEIDGGEAQI